MIIEIHNPEVEAKIMAQAQARGVSVEVLIASIIESLNGVYKDAVEGDDPRIAAMREAVNDELFMADLRETMEDFKYADAEYSH
jgi:hypothetical protein